MSVTAEAIAADLTLRPATFDDAAFAADVQTAVRPERPQDPVMWRYWWEHPWDDSVWTRFVASAGGRPVGFCQTNRPRRWEDMPERFGRIAVELAPEARMPIRLDALMAFTEDHVTGQGARRTSQWIWEDDAPKLAVAAARGFHEERRERFWELALAANRERLARMADASRARMREQGIRIMTLAEDTDPDRYMKLWRMSNEAEQDVPTTVPHVPAPFEGFMSSLRTPAVREDRVWIARIGDEAVGISMLGYPPVRGIVQTEWTGTARSVRGKGVARVLKCETVMQAIALGVDRVQTDNDSKNAPILHLNESMGYRITGEMIQLLKDLPAR